MESQLSTQKTVTRIPRPAGTTFLSIAYNQNQDTGNKDRLLAHVVYCYTSSGFRWNNKPIPLPTFAQIIQTPTNKIMELISKSGEQMGSLLNPDHLKSTIESIITLSASWAIQDRGQIQKQVEDLLRSQGGKYMPFVTSEVNKALKLTLDSNKNLIETFKSLLTNNQTNILNIFNQPGTSESESLLTPEHAIQLILDNNKTQQKALSGNSQPDNIAMLPAGKLEKLYQEHALGDAEEVREMASEGKALRPQSLEGQEAIELRESPHDNVSRRRGEDLVDYDELPNRE